MMTPENKLPVTNETGMQKVCQNNVIALHEQELKLKFFTRPEREALDLVLLAIAFDLGISNTPDPQELKRINTFLIRFYKDMSIAEIQYACDLYAAERIAQNLNHYNTFSKSFLGSLLNAYRKYRQDELNKVPPVVKGLLPETSQMDEKQLKEFIRLSDANSWKLLEDIIKEKVQDDQEPMPIGWDWAAVFNHLYRTKKIQLNAKDITTLRKKANEQLQLEDKGRKQEARPFAQVVYQAGQKESVEKRMKKISVQQFINNNYGKK